MFWIILFIVCFFGSAVGAASVLSYKKNLELEDDFNDIPKERTAKEKIQEKWPEIKENIFSSIKMVKETWIKTWTEIKEGK